MTKLMARMATAAACLVLASAAFAQTCEDIHQTATNDGCAPSDLAGQSVSVTGVVYVQAGVYNSGSVYFQCGAGGMLLFESGATYAEGDEITVTGTIGAFGSEIQFDSGATVVVNSSGNAVTPTSISTGSLAAGGTFLGDFMEVEATLVSLDSDGFNDVYTLNDGSGPVVMFVDGTTGIDQTQVDALIGQTVKVRGSTKCFNGVGEILPRRQGDITATVVAVQNVKWGQVKTLYLEP